MLKKHDFGEGSINRKNFMSVTVIISLKGYDALGAFEITRLILLIIQSESTSAINGMVSPNIR